MDMADRIFLGLRDRKGAWVLSACRPKDGKGFIGKFKSCRHQRSIE